LNAIAFDGLCTITSNRDMLFPLTDGIDPNSLINKYLNKRYSRFDNLISREYASRIGRPAGIATTRCSGFEISRGSQGHP
jgi:hypothetical protein